MPTSNDLYGDNGFNDWLNSTFSTLNTSTPASTPASPEPASTNFDSSNYDPNVKYDPKAGYNDALTKIIQEKGHIGRRALKRFNKQWNADSATREAQWKLDQNERKWDSEMGALRSRMDKFAELLKANTQPKTETPAVEPVLDAPVVTNSTPQGLNEAYWLKRAQQYGFDTLDQVEQWQRDNGLVADRKFGNNSIAKYNELKAQQAEDDDPEIQKWNTNPNPYSNGNLQSTINSINPQSPQTPTPSSLIDELIASNKLQTGWGYGHLAQDNQKIINDFLKSKGQTVPGNLTRWGIDDWYKKYFGEDEFNRLKKYIRTDNSRQQIRDANLWKNRAGYA